MLRLLRRLPRLDPALPLDLSCDGLLDGVQCGMLSDLGDVGPRESIDVLGKELALDATERVLLANFRRVLVVEGNS